MPKPQPHTIATVRIMALEQATTRHQRLMIAGATPERIASCQPNTSSSYTGLLDDWATNIIRAIDKAESDRSAAAQRPAAAI